MNKIAGLIPVACLLIVLSHAVPANADEGAVKKAVEAADNWLSLVDSDKYSESWEAAAAFFKGAVKKEKWPQSLASVRRPLGKVISRRLKSRQYTTSMAGAADGEYVVIQYETSFENKKAAVETVTPMREKDGSWKVSGYYIR
ncbi:MAG: DUF4019 domain-containing protein [Nitrospirae bacterium]|nr:DUF4019 domain-containing protein [Nitrospirota bacterium]